MEKQVNGEMPPMFLVVSKNDEVVKHQNSVVFLIV